MSDNTTQRVTLPLVPQTDEAVAHIALMQADAVAKLQRWADNDAGHASRRKGLEMVRNARGDIHFLNPLMIEVEENWNSRDFTLPENIEHVNDLAESIVSEGVKEPLTVLFREGHVLLRNGECRLRAVMLALERGAPIEQVPCIAENRFNNTADSLVQQFIANKGKSFSASETATHFRRLASFMDVTTLARRVGKSVSYVNSMLALHGVSEPIQEAVKAGAIAPTEVLRTLTATHGNMGEAERRITSAITLAQKEGRNRATARHVAAATPNASLSPATVRKRLRDIFEGARVDRDREGSEYRLAISPHEYDEVVRLLALTERQPDREYDMENVEDDGVPLPPLSVVTDDADQIL